MKGCFFARRMRMRAVIFCAVFLAAVSLFHGPAWSLELVQPSSAVGAGEKYHLSAMPPSPVSANEDSCLPYLKQVRFSDSHSAMDRGRRSAGKAAAAGLVFGLRFALGPKEVRKPSSPDISFDIWQPREDNGLQAMAVAQYRNCKNKQTLKSLSDWRWER